MGKRARRVLAHRMIDKFEEARNAGVDEATLNVVREKHYGRTCTGVWTASNGSYFTTRSSPTSRSTRHGDLAGSHQDPRGRRGEKRTVAAAPAAPSAPRRSSDAGACPASGDRRSSRAPARRPFLDRGGRRGRSHPPRRHRRVPERRQPGGHRQRARIREPRTGRSPPGTARVPRPACGAPRRQPARRRAWAILGRVDLALERYAAAAAAFACAIESSPKVAAEPEIWIDYAEAAAWRRDARSRPARAIHREALALDPRTPGAGDGRQPRRGTGRPRGRGAPWTMLLGRLDANDPRRAELARPSPAPSAGETGGMTRP